jgi:hypothetical protein
MKKIILTFLLRILAIIISLYATLPVLAEQASAESADFTVNTIPEPSALVLLLIAGFLLRSGSFHR